MRIEQDTLDDWARQAHAAHNDLLCLQRADPHAAEPRGRIWRLMRALVRFGAVDPVEAGRAETRREMRLAGEHAPEPAPLPLALLDSPAARAYAEAIATAAAACRRMEDERYGPNCDGRAEMLQDLADEARFQVYGPVGLRE